ncbi:RHS repeat-associated core domain-containing protein [Pseudomonas syringae]|uniref:RHS repeat-associated core domain-containing protein n=1 Tax=Pseudomonas syringae TaxID=317 RepID=UPI001F168076|nr:RHS repeat-associated core domain-containing protein [Pseudomonas syringae]MCF5708857.1 RHS repeat-associated core domain-containing protein [Pseudomonas syringae]
MNRSAQNIRCRYRYDSLDRLVSSTPATYAGSQRFYQKNRLASEIRGALYRTMFQYDDVLLAQRQSMGEMKDATLLATDLQCSVLQLVDKTSTEALAYTPYGHHPADCGLGSLLGFSGEDRDFVTGHYLLGNGYRAFNPVLMRFNSPDSLSPLDEGGLNAYAYCQGNPVNFKDPTGHISYAAILSIGRSRHSLEYMRVLRRIAPVSRVIGSARTSSTTASASTSASSTLPRAASSGVANVPSSSVSQPVASVSTPPAKTQGNVYNAKLNRLESAFLDKAYELRELRYRKNQPELSKGQGQADALEISYKTYLVKRLEKYRGAEGFDPIKLNRTKRRLKILMGTVANNPDLSVDVITIRD